MEHALTTEIADRFVTIALGHVTRPWPHALQHVLRSADDLQSPQELHPIFYGSFDWHSCVHSYWLMARAIRLFPDIPRAAEVRSLIDRQFTRENVAGEIRYLKRPGTRGFERPYGWAWLLALAGELKLHQTKEGKRWSNRIEPLAKVFAGRWKDYLPLADYPVRSGVHSNTAFALLLTMDYAKITGDDQLHQLCQSRAIQWYASDRACQVWEPNQNDFLSPSLTEAACMQRVLPKLKYRKWLTGFLPEIQSGRPATLFSPAKISDRADGQIAHLDGLNLSRAWCWKIILQSMATDDPRRSRIQRAIDAHLKASLSHLSDNFMGEHWLATFAMLAMEG